MKYIFIILVAVAIVGIAYLLRWFVLGLRFGLQSWNVSDGYPDLGDIEPDDGLDIDDG